MDALEKKKRRESRKKRRAEDPDFRKKENAASNAYRERNRENINTKQRLKYATDPQYRAKQLANKARNRRKRQLAIYGMSLRDYDDRMAEQQGACLICKRTFPYPLCVDHCHETREVRSLLCIRCNLGLGNYEDNPVFLRNAANLMDEWLRRHPELRKLKGVEMIPTDELTDDGKASLMVRRAILHELRQPPGADQPPPADRLQQIVRSFLDRAGQGDMTAIKEVLDRVDGKAPPGPAAANPNTSDDTRTVSIAWQDPTDLSTTGAADHASPSTRDGSDSPAS